MKKILIYKSRNLLGSSGGIEKMISFLANNLSNHGHTVHIATRDPSSKEMFFPLEKHITLKKLPANFNKIRHFIGKLFNDKLPYFNRNLYYSKQINDYCREIKPDIIITTGIKDLHDITAYTPYPCKKILQIHTTPQYLLNTLPKKMLSTLNKADYIQVLLPDYADTIQQYCSIPTAIIANPVFPIDTKTSKENTIIYASRIEPNKQHHLLIKAFSLIADKHPDWQIHFYGQTNSEKYKKLCSSLIKQHKLSKQIIFKGTTNKLQQKLKTASICAFPSAYEGFSLALTEAMAAGLPAIGFQTSDGIRQLIINDKSGYLVTTVEEMADKLDLLINDKKHRTKLGQNAQRQMLQFHPDKIIRQWLDLINKLV